MEILEFQPNQSGMTLMTNSGIGLRLPKGQALGVRATPKKYQVKIDLSQKKLETIS